MKKGLSLMVGACIAASLAFGGGHGVHWGYSGEGAPEHWGDLSKDFVMCKMGKNQSPIDLRTASAYETDLAPIVFGYHAGSLDEVNNGHSVQVNMRPGSYIMIDGIKFELKQFHFHTPSENTIDGKYFPFEAHFVHVDEKGNIAVVALMFEYGRENEVLARFWNGMPERAGDRRDISLPADEIKKLLPADRSYYRFNGSLTTPPCSEGVRWFVLKKAATISKQQVEQFARVMGEPNNRPVQPLNARCILK
jgi:carbonic anhydrase